MDQIFEFVAQFTDEKITGIEKIGDEYFLVDPKLSAINKSTGLAPRSIGIFLGKEKDGKFKASLPLIELLSKKSSKKVFIDEKAEWLFLCGRDIFSDSIIHADYIEKGFVFIQNAADENLGLGQIVKDLSSKGAVIKNIIDKGDYLRREMKKRR